MAVFFSFDSHTMEMMDIVLLYHNVIYVDGNRIIR